QGCDGNWTCTPGIVDALESTHDAGCSGAGASSAASAGPVSPAPAPPPPAPPRLESSAVEAPPAPPRLESGVVEASDRFGEVPPSRSSTARVLHPDDIAAKSPTTKNPRAKAIRTLVRWSNLRT